MANRDINQWSHLEGVNVQAIETDVGLLIGNNCPAALQPGEVRTSQNGEPYAIRTVFGWAINGPLGKEKSSNPTANYIDANKQLNQQFEEYCNLQFNDSAYATKLSLSQIDQKALQIMEDSIELKDGHYQIALPWNRCPPKLENNKEQAEA